ncbi:MAG: PQQ-binding-like beta-propeller repeat protein [Pirellulales bacterium]
MHRWLGFFAVAILSFLSLDSTKATDLQKLKSIFGEQEGIVGIVVKRELTSDAMINIAKQTNWQLYVQSDDASTALQLRQAADREGLLGRRIFIHEGNLATLAVSHNLLDALVIAEDAVDKTPREELLRVIRPKAKVLIGNAVIEKQEPAGMDNWSHPFHAPDNNTQSNDQLVRGDFQTQFIGFPKFSPMPEQSVIAGGRIYKAMGHIAHKENQNEWLNTLLCINAYNGTIVWKRPLSEGFMIHRNTMVATDDGLYMGDHESCKVYDAVTGEIRRQITIDSKITDGPCWKWMGIQGDTLYALVGNPEVEISTIRSDRPGIGHWPWGMWEGHDYKDLRTAFGHGRTFVAIDVKTGTIKWHYRDNEFLDARAVCMKGDRIYAFCAERFLLCLDAKTGKQLWRNTDADLLAAIGPNEKAQHYITGYATTTYIKCNDDYLFFAGPQRKQTVVASTQDGKLLWTHSVGNLQLVLRPEAIYAAGPENTKGMLLDYKTGSELATLPARRACTRATGCADSVFFRATGGTVRVMVSDDYSHVDSRHIAPMRPPCQDGVLISNGHLYWGPWMCGCQLSLYGNIGLRPSGQESSAATSRDLQTLEKSSMIVYSTDSVTPLASSANDWPTFQASVDRSSKTGSPAPFSVADWWQAEIVRGEIPTAPVTAGGLVFVADRAGAVRAFNTDGSPKWTSYTGGAIYFAPCVAHDRLYVGSADGRVYAFEAASGKRLWSYRVAPNEDRISTFGTLISRHPVAGGVVAHGNRIYAAAGLTHYDGTYVVALNALTGKPEASNETTGMLSEQVHSGVSMQGELSIVGNQLRFAGGGVYELAAFDLKDLTCLNEPKNQLTSQYRTAFYAYYPEYNKFVSLEHQLSDGRVLSFDANYDGSEFSGLSLEPPRPLGIHGKVQKDLAGEFLRRRGRETPTNIWKDEEQRRFTGFAVFEKTLLATGHSATTADKPFLVSIDIETGKKNWQKDLPAEAVKGGIAVDSQGRVFVTLENGRLLAFK